MENRFWFRLLAILLCILLFANLIGETMATPGVEVYPQNGIQTFLPMVSSGSIPYGFTRISFDQYPDGSSVTEDTILHGDEYAGMGALLAGAPEGSYCTEATTTAIQVPPHSTGVVDFTFLTSSRPPPAGGCNAVAVEFTFQEEVRAVVVLFGGAATDYILTAYDGEGQVLGTALQRGLPEGEVSEVEFGTETALIKRVTFGRELAVTAIAEIRFKH